MKSTHFSYTNKFNSFFCLGITQEMDQQLWLLTQIPKIVSEDVEINEDNCIDEEKEYHQEKAQVASQSGQSYHFACIHR